MAFNINLADTFNKELSADKNKNNTRRQVFEAAFSWVDPKKVESPKLIHANEVMMEEIGIEGFEVNDPYFTQVFSGNTILEHTKPYAMAYGGHQFGNWAGQLGDGRAINLFEVLHEGKRWAIQLKGAGETPFSRTADGLAVLRSSIREYLCSEAMYHLGVPTTRALSLMLSGDQVLRDMMYDGNAAYEKGAIVTRVAPSFIRFGNFELFAARKDLIRLKELLDYTIKHFYPDLGKPSKETYIAFYKEVADRTLKMIIDWQRVGFVHGVMNTDNFSILGLTIDYGPYGWLEGYDHGWTPNTTDRQHKRYRFGNQGSISLWNIYQLGNALFPLIEDEKPLQEVLDSYQSKFEKAYFDMMKSKLGLFSSRREDELIIDELYKLLHLE
ncbi:MAG: YdiU family protein, partial [Bacteroidota bacterium]